MDNIQDYIEEIVPIDNKKCYSCGKVFKLAADLPRHKNRKTPCLIRNVVEADRLNPNRCIFCNKTFANVGNRNKHLSTCKIKNGGMDILDEKIRHEQELRILREETCAQQERIKAQERELIILRDGIKLQAKETQEFKADIRAQIADLKAAPTQQIGTQVNGNGNQVNQVNQTFNFYNYDKPKVDTLKLTQDDLLVEHLMTKIIRLIYFNKDIPENHTLYLPNINKKRLLVHQDGSWVTVADNAIYEVCRRVKGIAGDAGRAKINNELAPDDLTFYALFPAVQNAIRSFNMGTEHYKFTDLQLFELIKSHRELIKATFNSVGNNSAGNNPVDKTQQ